MWDYHILSSSGSDVNDTRTTEVTCSMTSPLELEDGEVLRFGTNFDAFTLIHYSLQVESTSAFRLNMQKIDNTTWFFEVGHHHSELSINHRKLNVLFSYSFRVESSTK